MKNRNTPKNQTAHRILLIVCSTALAVAFTVSLPQPGHADPVTPPPVPDNLQVEEGNKAFLVGHAVGTQNYVCAPCPNPTTSTCPNASGFAWILFTPQATLFQDNDRQIIHHFFSPNPEEDNANPGVVADGMIRATWQDSRDTSTVWAKVSQSATSSTDPDFVAPGAVAWLLLEVVGAQDGPTGGKTLTETTFVQRLNTSGGVAPSMGCTSSADVGGEAFVPYTADYFFYKKAPESDAPGRN
jgi:hypothetical protein